MLPKNQLHGCYLAALFLALTTVTSCHKTSTHQPQLPAATMEGKNTMGAAVDGRIWEAGDTDDETFEAICSSYSPAGGLSMAMRSLHPGETDAPGDILSLRFRPLSATGVYDLTDSLRCRVQTIEEGEDETGRFIVTDGKLTISRLDTANKVISGLFYFTVVNQLSGVTHRVTDGRFDFQMNYCR